jgi:TolA-binding protein
LAAADRLRILANSSRGQAQAAPAHLLAAWNAAQAARSDVSATAQYEELLREHLAAWPNGEPADQARIWLGKLLETNANWAGAIDTYAGVSRASAHYAGAIEAAARCWRSELSRRDAANDAVSDAAAEAIRFFRRAVAGPENRWPERWTDADRSAALTAAEFIVAYQPGSASDAEELLRRSIAASPDAPQTWRTAAQAQLVVALAAQGGRQNDALTELRAVGGASPEQMFAVLDSLSRIAAGSGERGRASIANVQLAAVAMLSSSRDQFSRKQQLTLDRIRADGLAALGRVDEALAAYEQLSQGNLDDAELQRGFAKLLLSSADSTRLTKALDQWRLMASRAKPRSGAWYEAKYSVALAQFKLGDRAAATALLRYILQTPPGLKVNEWEAAYAELLRKCEAGGTK